ncbi:MAG TPA: cobalamin biosynthesis protein P47K [Planctomycetaceae bacterium]|nr:cobalamin biosynthesis protein P47K [Planctomycetaceae bacterium]
MVPKFVLVGGFLGAGKSTTVARLADAFTQQGKRVIIVTNDQAEELVDTHSLREQGFDVGEVAGACFCCSFNELTKVVENLSLDQRPDVIIAEPVGSCTDLVATVIRPLEHVYESPLEIAPYGVLLKPSHGQKILAGKNARGFSPKAEYIFRKQIEEADFVVLNRIDQLSAEEIEELEDALVAEYPNRPVLRMSAKTGEGFEAYLEFLLQSGQFGQRVLDIDYDIYAEGEAELGWLNCQAHLAAPEAVDLDDLLLRLVQRLQQRMIDADVEIAHLKSIGMWDGNYAVANAVSNSTSAELSLASEFRGSEAELVVNARVAASPELLESLVRSELQHAADSNSATIVISTLQSFRPGRPEPTHRMST